MVNMSIKKYDRSLADAGPRKLQRTINPRQHETGSSILWRLAVANGAASVRRLIAETPNLKLSAYPQGTGNWHASLAAQLGGFDEAEIARHTMIRNTNGKSMYGLSLSNSRLKNLAKVCLECLRCDDEKFDGPRDLRPYRRSWWSLHQISTCPTHRLPLLVACPNCNSSFDALASPVRCRCNPNFDLRRIRQGRLEDEEMAHDQWLLGRLGIADSVDHGILDAMDPFVASHLCFRIGMSSNSSRCNLRKEDSSEDFLFFNSEGWSILQNWPTTFIKHLAEICRLDETDASEGTKKLSKYESLKIFLRIKRNVGGIDRVYSLFQDTDQPKIRRQRMRRFFAQFNARQP